MYPPLKTRHSGRSSIRCAVLGIALILVASIGFPIRCPAADFRQFESWVGFDTGTYSTARYPLDGKTADLDNDGDPDLAVVNWWSVPKLGILLNQGDGSFAPPVQYPASGAYHLETADFDGDGFIDIAVADHGDNGELQTVSIYTNQGDGTFGTAVKYTVGTGPMGLAAADYDQDGDLDLAVAINGGFISQENSIAVLYNDGSGLFSGPINYIAGDPAARSDHFKAYRIRAGNMNGDSYPDLVVAHGKQLASVLLNDGRGRFLFPDTYEIPGATNDMDSGVALADVDHDSDLDVLYSSSQTIYGVNTGGVALLRNAGDGTLGNVEMIPLVIFANGAPGIETADVTGDGWTDILTALVSDANWVLTPANGSGGFEASIEMTAGEDPEAVQAADVDQDGDTDIVIVNRFSLEATVYLNPGNGDFTQPTTWIAGYMGNKQMDAADIDGDGDLDIAVCGGLGGYGGWVSILRNDGTGRFGPEEYYASSQSARAVKLRDLDGDNKPDLVWADDPDSPPYNFHTRLNLGDGTFGPVETWTAYTCGTEDLQAYDIDEDGDLDVLLTEILSCAGYDPNYVYIAFNNGDGTFQPAYLLAGDGTALVGMTAGDFDEDGHLDLAVTSSLGLDIFIGHGDGSFDSPSVITGFDGGVGFILTTDLNHDGHLDLATHMRGGSDIEQGLSILIGRGDGTFEPPVKYLGSYSFYYSGTTSIDARDADLDGDIDILVSNYGSQDVSYFENKGDGTFRRHIRYGGPGNLMDLRCSDFTGDGKPDLAVMTGVIGDVPANGGGVQVLTGAGAETMILDLVQDPPVRGQPVDLTVTGANEGERVFYLMSLTGTGQGPCPPQLGGMCLDLLEPITVLGTAVADVEGQAVLTETIPQNAPLVDVHTQAVIRRGDIGEASVKSNTVTDQIQP